MSGRERALADYAELVNPNKVAALQATGLEIVEGWREGVFVSDVDGRRFIDCFTSAGCFNLGRRNPRLVAALNRALNEEGLDLGNYSLLSEAKAELARRLAEITPGDLDCAMFGVGGGDAVDFGIKLARGYTGRPGIVSTLKGFHGHTGFALSATGFESYQRLFRPLMPGFVQVPYGDAEAAEAAVNDTTAAFVVEPVQGVGGVNIAPPGYLPALLDLCHERGALLMVDEVQTGFGRTGEFFATQHWGVTPDIMSVAKSLGGGLYPISATLFRRPLQEFIRDYPAVHLSTFGGADLGCRVALAVIDEIVDRGVLAHCTTMGHRFQAGFEKLRDRYPSLLVGSRHLGLMMAVLYADDDLGPRMSQQLAANGVVAIASGNQPSVMRLMPPLIIQAEQVDEVLAAFDRSLASIRRSRGVARGEPARQMTPILADASHLGD